MEAAHDAVDDRQAAAENPCDLGILGTQVDHGNSLAASYDSADETYTTAQERRARGSGGGQRGGYGRQQQ